MTTQRPEPTVRRATAADLTLGQVSRIRELMVAAFGVGEERFTDADWEHAIGGVHFLLALEGEIVGHASIVERALHLDGRPVRTGFVEAVAVAPARQGLGLGSRLMNDVNDAIREGFQLGALNTGRRGFYHRLGWRTWSGPTYVRLPMGPQRTAEEDGSILVLATPTSPPFDIRGSISCDWREGDAW